MYKCKLSLKLTFVTITNELEEKSNSVENKLLFFHIKLTNNMGMIQV